jgi:hypothetical protein
MIKVRLSQYNKKLHKKERKTLHKKLYYIKNEKADTSALTSLR